MWEHTSKANRRRLVALEPGDVLLDIGAYMGWCVRLARQRGAIVHAFEPHPDAYRILEHRYGSDAGVILHQTAAWDSDGEVTLSVAPSRLAMQTATCLPVGGERKIVVPTLDIGRYIAERNLHVKLLKIDCEGAEYRVIDSILSHEAHERIEQWCVEDHERFFAVVPGWMDRKRQVLEQLQAAGIVLDEWD